MRMKFIEATEEREFNWGKFLLMQFDSEFEYTSVMDPPRPLLLSQGWGSEHTLVLDLATGEGAMFKLDGVPHITLNQKHQIWVCPLFEPFLAWLATQDTTRVDKLPSMVNLGEVPTSMSGYRRKRDG